MMNGSKLWLVGDIVVVSICNDVNCRFCCCFNNILWCLFMGMCFSCVMVVFFIYLYGSRYISDVFLIYYDV